MAAPEQSQWQLHHLLQWVSTIFHLALFGLYLNIFNSQLHQFNLDVVQLNANALSDGVTVAKVLNLMWVEVL